MLVGATRIPLPKVLDKDKNKFSGWFSLVDKAKNKIGKISIDCEYIPDDKPIDVIEENQNEQEDEEGTGVKKSVEAAGTNIHSRVQDRGSQASSAQR